MSRREDIHNSIWSDPDFEPLSLEAGMLYLWSWTNQHCGMAGLYKATRRAMGESKVPDDRIDATFQELAAARFCFQESGVIFVRTRARHLRQKTPQIAKSIQTDVAKIAPDHPLRVMFLDEYRDAPWLRAFLSDADLATVTGGSAEGQENPLSKGKSVTLKRGSVDPHWQRQRQRTGNGPREGVQGEGPNWLAFAAEHLPDLPADLVAMCAVKLGNPDIDPEKLRRHVLAGNPALAKEQAA